MTSVYCSVIFSVTCTLKKKGPQAGQGIFSALYVSRSFDLLTFDVGQLSLTLAADHRGCGAGLITQAWTPAPHFVGIDLHSVIHQLT